MAGLTDRFISALAYPPVIGERSVLTAGVFTVLQEEARQKSNNRLVLFEAPASATARELIYQTSGILRGSVYHRWSAFLDALDVRKVLVGSEDQRRNRESGEPVGRTPSIDVLFEAPASATARELIYQTSGILRGSVYHRW
ncbi:UNVERIFIED_CONTAM: hypothetical protein FKN15_039708 [Acipenser sinensis]